MTAKHISRNLFRLFACLVVICMVSCTSSQKKQYSESPSPLKPHAEKIDWSRIPSPPENRELVAIVGFENKSS